MGVIGKVVKAFILANLDEKINKKSAYNKLEKIKEVTKVYSVFGNYDFALELEDTSLDQMRRTLSKELSFADVKSLIVMVRS